MLGVSRFDGGIIGSKGQGIKHMVGEIVLTSNDVSQRSEKMKLGLVLVLKKMYSGFSEGDNMLEALVNLAELTRALKDKKKPLDFLITTTNLWFKMVRIPEHLSSRLRGTEESQLMIWFSKTCQVIRDLTGNSFTWYKIARNCEESDLNHYTYKSLVKVMPLAMVDGLLSISRCGLDSTKLNIEINTRIEMKKLKFHTPDKRGKSKCHTIHIGEKSDKCPMLKVHGYDMEKVESDTYLGDIIASNGKNTLNIEAKGLGIVSQIMDTLKTVSFGEHYFEAAATLRESKLINVILTNCDVWYNLTKGEIEKLEEIDRLLL